MRNASYILASVGLVAIAVLCAWAVTLSLALTPWLLSALATIISFVMFGWAVITLLGVVFLYFEGYDPSV